MKKLLSIVLIITCFFQFGIFAKAENGENSLSLSAKSAILIEAESGKILYSKNANLCLPMASTTKIMTAVVVLENSNLSDIVKIDSRSVGIEGSSAYLKAGEEFTIEELLYALLLQSANDCAIALSIAVGGSVENFVNMMNDKAKQLGLNDTHFDNPNGLHSDTHYTTAYELAIISAYAMQNEDFQRIVATKTYSIKSSLTREIARCFSNHNKLLLTYQGIIGIKTGYTKNAGRCLVSACEKDDLRLIAVTLSAPNDWQDHKNLYDFGFANYQRTTLCKEHEYYLEVPIAGGGNITVQNIDSISFFEAKNNAEIQTSVELPQFVYSGVKKGDIVGKVIFSREGKIIGEVFLYSQTNTNSQQKTSIFRKIIEFIINLFRKKE